MERLIEGYRLFREAYFIRHRSMFDQLAQGQSPKAMVICCCDSRIDPALIFSAEPGEIFTLRNIANLVPPYAPDDEYHGTSAAIEFAVRSLDVQHIIVMGHARCGGVAALHDHHDGVFIGPWMQIAAHARTAVMARDDGLSREERLHILEKETIKISLANLRTFPWVRERVDAGHLTLHGWYFEIEDGEVQKLDEGTGAFSPL
jgi:carbonic anhydrase